MTPLKKAAKVPSERDDPDYQNFDREAVAIGNEDYAFNAAYLKMLSGKDDISAAELRTDYLDSPLGNQALGRNPRMNSSNSAEAVPFIVYQV